MLAVSLWPAGEQAKHSIQLAKSEVIILNLKSEEKLEYSVCGGGKKEYS